MKGKHGKRRIFKGLPSFTDTHSGKSGYRNVWKKTLQYAMGPRLTMVSIMISFFQEQLQRMISSPEDKMRENPEEKKFRMKEGIKG